MHSDMFGDDCVTFKDGNASVTVDGVAVSIHIQTRVSSACVSHSSTSQHHLGVQTDLSDLVLQAVSSEDESLREMVEVAVQRLYDALSPSADTSSSGRGHC